MRLYIEFIKNSLLVNSTYRFNLFLRLFNRIIALFISVSIWKALYWGSAETASNMGSVSLKDMIMYSIISSSISVFISNNVISIMNDKIKSGAIGLDLLKPINYKAWQFCNVLGNNISSVIMELIPVVVIGSLVFGFQPTTFLNFVLFLAALFNGIVINFLITYILGLLGFWYLEIWHFDRLLQDLIRLFSGAWIPLWFFPGFLFVLSNYLPFKFIYFAPTSIYLQKVSLNESLVMLLQQFAWIAILLLLERLLWKKGIKRLVIQGG